MPSRPLKRFGVNRRSESHRCRQESPMRAFASRIDEFEAELLQVVADRQAGLTRRR